MSRHPRIRLLFSTVLWRSFAILAFFMEIGLYHRLRPWLQNRSGAFRVKAMILKSPQMLTRAFLWAAVIAVVLDLYVRLVLRPIYARWYAPRRSEADFDAFQSFQLGSGDRIVSEIPARRQSGWRTERGTLLRTSDAVWFAPNRWDADIWTAPTAQIDHAACRPKSRAYFCWIVGTPDPVTLVLDDGSEQVFHAADPAQVLSWFPPSTI